MRFRLAFVFLLAAGVQGFPKTTEEAKLMSSRKPRAAIPIPRSPEEVMSFPVSSRNNEICGIRRNSVPDLFTRIVGGTEAERNEFPWQVSLQYVSNWYTHHICGGTVIDQRWIMTAAHCTHIYQSYQLIVVAGEHNLKRKHGEEQTRNIETMIEHPQYNARTQEYDMAMIKLSQPLILDGVTVSPICLPPYFKQFMGDGLVTGWGDTEEGGESSDVLMKVVVPIITDEECRDDYRAIGYSGPITDNMMCAGYPAGGKDACQGDSGGPFICLGDDKRYYLAGVVSWGIGCAQPGVPGVYTEVSHFVPWVIDVISNRFLKSPRPISMRVGIAESQGTTADATEGEEEQTNITDDGSVTLTSSMPQQQQ
ncbi:trypsin-1-like isoform X2 [Portunus trituberculatus]|uniref:trypsin-1-like isoform X2 n=1 Tax=Portunus trituberculatus TaxID=210409 RepID=UPI001E1D1210|nr:trypsin-1-like isoform X2 [Portunus trituberculatus]